MATEIEIPNGYKLLTYASYKIPSKFNSIEVIKVTDRKWWQFWRPKEINIYTALVEK